MRQKRIICSNAAALALLLAAPMAWAVDGVLEINQACATGGGCFPGDEPGFPVTISEPGSYRLTSSLQLFSPDENAIEITTQAVSIDLNGFRLKGPVICGGVPLVCNASGPGVGVSSGQGRAAIRNGFVQGFGDLGIALLGGPAHIEDVNVHDNAGGGIETGSGALVKNCNVSANGGVGVSVDSASLVSDNRVTSNNADGIQARESAVTDNTLTFNNGDAIETSFGPSIVTGNVAYFNRDFGLRLASGTGYGNNSVNNNDNGTVDGGIEIGANVCNGDTTCP